MKKIVLLSVVFSLLFSSFCYGADSTYRINEKDIDITIDNDDFDFVCINNSFMSLNPYYNFEDIFQISEDDYIETMTESDLWFDAFDYENRAEVYVKVAEDDSSKYIYDLNNYNEYEIYQYLYGDDYQATLDEYGMSDMKSSVVNIHSRNYLYSELLLDTTFAASYYTVKNGIGIWISLNMSNDCDTTYYTSVLSEIVESVEYDNESASSIPTVNVHQSKQSSSNDFLSGLTNKTLMGLISGAIMGTIAVLIGKLRGHKKDDEEKTAIVQKIDTPTQTKCTSNTSDLTEQDFEQLKVDFGNDSIASDNIQENCKTAESSDSDSSGEIEFDVIEEKAAEYAAYSYNLAKDYTPKQPALINIYCEIDLMILVSFFSRYTLVFTDNINQSKINDFVSANLSALNYLIADRYGFSQEEARDIIENRFNFYDAELMSIDFTIKDGFKIISESFHIIIANDKQNNNIEHYFSGKTTIPAGSTFDLYVAVISVYETVVKFVTQEVNDIKKYLM